MPLPEEAPPPSTRITFVEPRRECLMPKHNGEPCGTHLTMSPFGWWCGACGETRNLLAMSKIAKGTPR